MGKHSITAELRALREGAATKHEHDTVNLLGKLYGLISAQQFQIRILSGDDSYGQAHEPEQHNAHTSDDPNDAEQDPTEQYIIESLQPFSDD